MGLGTFLVMLFAFTGAAVTVISVIAYHVKRMPAKSAPGQLSAEEVDAVRAHLAEVEQRELRVADLEERLDFVERALGRTRQAPSLRDPTEK